LGKLFKTKLFQTALNAFQEDVYKKAVKAVVSNLLIQLQAIREGDFVDWAKIKKTFQVFQ